MTIKFGYYPAELSLDVGAIIIRTLPDLGEIIKTVTESEYIDNDWIHSPQAQVRDFEGGIRTLPYPGRVFSLPKTHTFQHSNADNEDRVAFHLWVFSFFSGMRLTAVEAGFLDATPIKPGKLVDFVLARGGLDKALELSEIFWIENRDKPESVNLFSAAVHALFLGQNPRYLQFEKFVFLYTALDTCYSLACSLYAPPKRLQHAKRISWMCDLFAMKTPSWAAPSQAGVSEVALLRNAAIHEARFGNAPLGFALHGIGTNQNLVLEMQGLICRLLVALLGAAASHYVRTPINTRQRFGLEILKC